MSDTTPGAADAARHYMQRGWRPIRLHGITPAGRCTCRDGHLPDHKSAGKHPTETAWQNTPPMTEAEVAESWRVGGWTEHCNVGIATGDPSGFFVLDIDPDNGGTESARQLQADYTELPRTTLAETGSGGWHLLYQMPDDFEITNSNKGLRGYPGLDIRGTGGQIVAAPSKTPKGSYRWLDSRDPVPAPQWLLELLRPKATSDSGTLPAGQIAIPEDDEEAARCEMYSVSVRDAEVMRLIVMAENAVPEGQHYVGEPWNETTFSVACALLELANSPWTLYDAEQARTDVFEHAPRDSGFGLEEIKVRWESAVSTVGDRGRPYPVKREEVYADWASEPGVRVDPILLGGNGPRQPEQDEKPPVPMRSWDDLGNAMRIVDHFGHGLRWVEEAEQWAIFRGGRWKLVQSPVIQGYVQRMIHDIIPATEAMQYSDDPVGDPPAAGEEDTRGSERADFLKWLKGQRMSARIAAAQNEAKGRHELHVSVEAFDADPMLFNCANGVLDLRTGTLSAPRPEHMLMRQSPVAFDPEAKAPMWDAFLERMQPDEDMRSYLQRCLGYSLSGHIREQAFFIHHGDGANGKSICTEAVGAIMGEYGQTVASSTLLSSTNEEHPAGVAMMQGKRWLPATETAPGKRLDEEKVKNLTGDAKVTARFMGKNWFEFEPSGKIHLVTNHLPFLSDAKSIWRRIHLIRWGVSLEEWEWDRDLGAKLTRELPGILNWLVAGALAWQVQGLNPPAVALEDKAEYRGDSDIFGDFLRERTMPAPGIQVPTEVFYRAYQSWCFDQGIRRPMSQPAFVATMKERKIPQHRSPRVRGFSDIMVVAPATAPVIAPVPWE